MVDNVLPWWATRFEQLAALDPRFAGAVDAVADAQVDLLERLLGLQAGDRVLDLGCGAGRHVILLHERGAVATGVDLSPAIIQLARDGWKARHPSHSGPAFVVGDMRDPPVEGPFDVVLFMDASLGLFERDADHLQALSAASSMLREGGALVLELMNPFFWAHQAVVRHFPPGSLAQEADLVRSYHFDPTRGVLEDRMVVFREGVRIELPTQVLRLWTPTEVTALVEAAGFRDSAIYGSDGFHAAAEPRPLHAQNSAFYTLVARV
jgi:SAM-dependent methyltransferase